MTRLSYHQNVFDLLDIELDLSEEALRMIEECERRCGASLPRALRDWYATEQVVPLRRATSEVVESDECPLWSDYSNMDSPLPLDVVLASFEQLNGDEAPTGKRFLEILVENQGVWVCSVELTGSNDPPVWYNFDYEQSNPVEWECVASHFSDFVFDWFARFYVESFTPLSAHPLPWHTRPPSIPTLPWSDKPKRYLNGLWLRSPRATVLFPPHIDFLLERAEDESRVARANGLTTYRFTLPTGRLRVTTDPWNVGEGYSAWWLHADSEEGLESLARTVWHIGSLSESLRSSTDSGTAVLQRLRTVE